MAKDKDDNKADLSQIPPQAATNAEGRTVQLSGAVIEKTNPGRAFAAKGDDVVTLRKLDRTVGDPIFGRVGPSNEPVKVSYSTAFTFGLLDDEISDEEAKKLTVKAEKEAEKAAKDEK